MAGHAGIIDEGIEPAERADRFSDQSATLRLLAHVGDLGQDLCAELFAFRGDVFQSLLVARREAQGDVFAAGFRILAGQLGADAIGGACNDDHVHATHELLPMFQVYRSTTAKWAEKPKPNAAKRWRPHAPLVSARCRTNKTVAEDMLP